MYNDNTFRANPSYPDASRYASGEIENNSNRGVILVRLGGVDESDVDNISGGWSRVFELKRRSNITIAVVFQLQVAKEFARTEVSEVLCSLDGKLLRNGPDEFLAQLSGERNIRMLQIGNADDYNYIGFKEVRLSVTNVTAGNHTLVVGGHLTRKTYSDERTIIRFDTVQVYVNGTSDVAKANTTRYLR